MFNPSLTMIRFGLLSSPRLNPLLFSVFRNQDLETYHLPCKEMDSSMSVGYREIIRNNMFKMRQIDLYLYGLDYLISTEDGYLQLDRDKGYVKIMKTRYMVMKNMHGKIVESFGSFDPMTVDAQALKYVLDHDFDDDDTVNKICLERCIVLMNEA